MYVDSFEGEEENQKKSAQQMLEPCIDVALQVNKTRINVIPCHFLIELLYLIKAL